MNESSQPHAPRFRVTVTRVDERHALAQAHGQTLDLAIKGGDPTLGFTPPETILAAFGACMLSNVTRGAAELGLRVDEAWVVFDGARRTEPLGIDPLRYQLVMRSPEPPAALEELYRRATTDGTATNALLGGMAPEGELIVEAPTGLPS